MENIKSCFHSKVSSIYYFATLNEGDGGVQDFIHTENFVLVDTKKRIRGYYDGTNSKDMERLASEMEILLEEESGEK